MTTTYDPLHPSYLDEYDVRGELSRVWDVCQGCRQCVDLCPTFPSLFELIDRRDGDAGSLTPADQDRVAESCFQCTRCAVDCPYVPGAHELRIDFPRLMLRAAAMRRARGLAPRGANAAARVMGRADLIGAMLSAVAPLANRILRARPNGWTRRVVTRVAGVSAIRPLPPFARERFSTWFARRPNVRLRDRRGAVTVYPTCFVEYQEPGIGRDLVQVYERNGVECARSRAGCCGAPSLHAGDIARFAQIAEANVRTLAAEVRRGTDIVVPQPGCAHVVRREYVPAMADPERRADAELVAAHTFDACEFLMRIHTDGHDVLDTDFDGDVAAQVTYHPQCQLAGEHVGLPGRDLLWLTGARVELVQQCAGLGGMWGLRAANDDVAEALTDRLGALIEAADGDVVAGDCHLANTALSARIPREPLHPLQVLARAYGGGLAP